MRAHAEIQISPKDIYDYVCNDSDEDCPKHSYLETTATAVIFTFCHRAMTGEPRRWPEPRPWRDQHHGAIEQEHTSEEQRYYPTKEVADSCSRHRTTIEIGRAHV